MTHFDSSPSHLILSNLIIHFEVKRMHRDVSIRGVTNLPIKLRKNEAAVLGQYRQFGPESCDISNHDEIWEILSKGLFHEKILVPFGDRSINDKEIILKGFQFLTKEPGSTICESQLKPCFLTLMKGKAFLFELLGQSLTQNDLESAIQLQFEKYRDEKYSYKKMSAAENQEYIGSRVSLSSESPFLTRDHSKATENFKESIQVLNTGRKSTNKRKLFTHSSLLDIEECFKDLRAYLLETMKGKVTSARTSGLSVWEPIELHGRMKVSSPQFVVCERESRFIVCFKEHLENVRSQIEMYRTLSEIPLEISLNFQCQKEEELKALLPFLRFTVYHKNNRIFKSTSKLICGIVKGEGMVRNSEFLFELRRV